MSPFCECETRENENKIDETTIEKSNTSNAKERGRRRGHRKGQNPHVPITKLFRQPNSRAAGWNGGSNIKLGSADAGRTGDLTA